MKKSVDELLIATAKIKTEELHLPSLLTNVKQSKKTFESAPVRKNISRRGMLLIAAAVCAVLCVTPLLLKTVVVEGKPYIAFQGKVKINGEEYSISGAAADTPLVRLSETSNQYALLSNEGDNLPVMVFPPNSAPRAIENEQAVSAKTDEAQSIEPVIAYPIVGDLVIRAGPGTQYAEYCMLYAGQCVKKVGIHGNWAIIECGDGLAYVFNKYLFEAPKPIPRYEGIVQAATEPVNVRALPTSRDESAVLYELQQDEQVVCTGVIGAWSQIEYRGDFAYVFSKYLKNVR